MAHRRKNQEKPEEQEEESRRKKKARRPVYEQLKAQDDGVDSGAGFLVEPSPDSHAALLADLHSDEQRASLVNQLQQSYGNVYVQQVMERIQSGKGSGQPLGAETRSEMEAAFHQDLGDVRIHTDASASEVAKELGAKAFTSGKDVFFKEAAYQPGSETSHRLLMHEIAHVVQQSNTPPASPSRISHPEETAEIEAATAEQKAGASPIVVSRLPADVVARQVEIGGLAVKPVSPGPKAKPIPAGELKVFSVEVPDLTVRAVEEVKKLIKAGKKQGAINRILKEVKATKMPNLDKCLGKTIKYSKKVSGEGLCSCTYDPKANKALKIWVQIGDAAFSSVAVLYSSMMHEYQHVNQYLTDPKKTAGNDAMAEFEAYSWEIFHAQETGMSQKTEEMKDLGGRLKGQGWDPMTEEEQKGNKETYDKAIEIIRKAIGDKGWQP
jgi:hypothetical protein